MQHIGSLPVAVSCSLTDYGYSCCDLQIAQELDALERAFLEEGGGGFGPGDTGNVAADGMFSIQASLGLASVGVATQDGEREIRDSTRCSADRQALQFCVN